MYEIGVGSQEHWKWGLGAITKDGQGKTVKKNTAKSKYYLCFCFFFFF